MGSESNGEFWCSPVSHTRCEGESEILDSYLLLLCIIVIIIIIIIGDQHLQAGSLSALGVSTRKERRSSHVEQS
ncbi:hypothetical protein GN956_G2549 [Arapaima gigas]